MQLVYLQIRYQGQGSWDKVLSRDVTWVRAPVQLTSEALLGFFLMNSLLSTDQG